MTTTRIMEIIKTKNGQIIDGVDIWTRQDIMADQINFDDLDYSNLAEFSSKAFWVTTDNGDTPIGIDTDEELANLMSL